MPSCEMMMMTKATMEMQWTGEHGGVLRGREQTLLVHAMGLWNSDLVWRDEDGGMKGTRKDTIDSTEHVAVIMSVLSRDDCKDIRYNSLQKHRNRERIQKL